MPKFDLRGVHVMKRVPGSHQFRLAEVHPALRLGKGDEHLYIQNGTVFDEGGTQVKDLPGWFAEEVAKCSPHTLAECGYAAVQAATAQRAARRRTKQPAAE